jgi:beta-N-acetylhexosaminidase
MKIEFRPGDRPDSFGYKFIIGISGGATLDDNDKRILAALKPAGVLLLAKNFKQNVPYEEWTEVLARLLNDIKYYSEREQILVSIDHEGGRVVRTPAPITRFPSPAQYATRSSEVASAMAKELISLGVNVSFAPLADINTNPKNPIIGVRAFSEDKDKVAQYSTSFLKAMEENGLMGCAKHFPGHGDTFADSHLELPLVFHSDKELMRRELVPFKALIDSGVSLIMTAHVMYPKIDTLYAATTSERILKDILREKLGFQQVIISDDIEMKAVSELFKQPYTIAFSVRCGCDMFIIARNDIVDYKELLSHPKNLSRSLIDRRITEDDLHESYKRIERVLSKLKHTEVKILDEKVFKEHKKLASEIEHDFPASEANQPGL